ncbi:ATP-binding protein [Colwellia sp. 12G3]|uniref:ATP-binding protein n=1 Tax=Colwellia sp. 12G3 TaxID=2058299 RepID=UPI000C33B5FC|nr:ATP-binding protein [Colwellia sp. 12G3]PKI12948.1 AAA family ATPase [Colwellia sp. 12G3]
MKKLTDNHLRQTTFHSLASQFVLNAFGSTYFDEGCLSVVKASTVRALTGKSLAMERIPEEEKYQQLCKHLNRIASDNATEAILRHNCKLLAQGLGLPKGAEKLLTFLTVYTKNIGLNQLFDDDFNFTCENIDQVVADINGNSIQNQVNAIKALSSTGLFMFDNATQVLELTPLPSVIIECLTHVKAKSYSELVAQITIQPTPSNLSLADFDYVQSDTLLKLIKQAVSKKLIGVNILIYGIPGTGKTELAKALLAHLNNNLYEIKPIGDSLDNPEDEFNSRTSSACLRLQYHKLVQKLCHNDRKCVLLIDECEDIFRDYQYQSRISKDTLHSVLENNTIPTIWITNHLDELEESCIRRFKFVVEIPQLNVSTRKRIIDKLCKGLNVSIPFKDSLARKQELSPAVIDNGTSIAKLLKQKSDNAENTLTEVIDNTLKACGYDTEPLNYKQTMSFEPQLVNLMGNSSDVTLIEHAVSNNRDVRSLLLGPPGTGKTALVHHLADKLDMPLITAKCSDIIDKYVGESEKNVAELFKRAHREGAILLLDEVDSLLLSRDGLDKSWEVQLVNELLTQMESFTQPLFAATNYSGKLDKAVMRRFDFKLQFDYLTHEQVLRFYKQAAHVRAIPSIIKEELLKLTHLTAGDFAIVQRRNHFNPKALTPNEIIDLLKAEVTHKKTAQAIGFIHH